MIFISYAQRDLETTPALHTFLTDLRNAITAQTGEDSKEISFVDSTNIDDGDEWPEEIRKALAECLVFVPIISPTYCTRENCGKEWFAILRRNEGITSPLKRVAIKPVWWIPLVNAAQPIPAAVLRSQLHRKDDPPEYRQDGLALLAMTNHSAYKPTVAKIGVRIAAAHKKSIAQPMPGLPPLDRLISAFPLTQLELGAIPKERLSSNPGSEAGPGIAQFMYVSPRKGEMASATDLVVRARQRRPESWIEDNAARSNWKPFAPPDGGDANPQVPEADTKKTRRAGALASEAAGGAGLTGDSTEFVADRERLENVIREAMRKFTPLVLMLDPWSLALRSFQDALSLLGEITYFNVALYVLWNDEDLGMKKARPELEKELRSVFFPDTVHPRPVPGSPLPRKFCIGSPEDLDAQLRGDLTALANRSASFALAAKRRAGTMVQI